MRSAAAIAETVGTRPVVTARSLLPAGVAAVSAALFTLAQPHLIDDAYITLSYAKNLAFHGHWGLIEHGTANTATSPLNVLAVAALTFVFRDAVFAAGVLFVLAQVATYFGLRRIGEHTGLPRWFAPLATMLLLANPLLVSSIGLELPLGIAGLSWLMVAFAERRPVAFGLAAGFLALVRLDLLVVVAVLFFARRKFWEGIWQTFFSALAVTLPWFLFSWLSLGSAVPDTLIIKTLQRSWGPWSVTNGPLVYFRHFPLSTTLSFLPLLAGGAVGLLWTVVALRGSKPARRLLPFAALAFGGALHYLVYSLLEVPPYHWYYGPSIACATIFLAAMVAAVPRHRMPAAIGVVVMAAASVAVYLSPGLPRDFAPITSNHATSEQYRAIGAELGRIANGRVVHSAGEIGALAYSCDCTIVDLFSDRGAVGPEINESKNRSGPLGRALIDANFRFLDQSVPPTTPDLLLVESTDNPPAGTIAGWKISSPWTGEQHLYLTTAPEDGVIG
ncbi:hypothetical protein AB5J62_00300 [Amycolatopsis sp. cg5]|uniref:hypothetical protein n=1 Tax=Amycolatopsis sp. cg5 TaxID=3238802 RepID=UPI0035242430